MSILSGWCMKPLPDVHSLRYERERKIHSACKHVYDYGGQYPLSDNVCPCDCHDTKDLTDEQKADVDSFGTGYVSSSDAGILEEGETDVQVFGSTSNWVPDSYYCPPVPPEPEISAEELERLATPNTKTNRKELTKPKKYTVS